MAGHSKWAQIRHKKAIQDKIKGKVFTKLSNAILIAARDDANSETNLKLKIAIERAKASNLPKNLIERSLERAKSKSEGANLEELKLEGYGPAGIGLLVLAITDNKNRTIAEARHVLNRFSGKLAEAGAVSWLFKPKGEVRLSKEQDKSPEEIELLAIDYGAEDVFEEEGEIIIITSPKNLTNLKNKLTQNNLKINSFEITFKPQNTITINDPKTAKTILSLMEALEGIDEVSETAANFDIPADLINDSGRQETTINKNNY